MPSQNPSAHSCDSLPHCFSSYCRSSCSCTTSGLQRWQQAHFPGSMLSWHAFPIIRSHRHSGIVAQHCTAMVAVAGKQVDCAGWGMTHWQCTPPRQAASETRRACSEPLPVHQEHSQLSLVTGLLTCPLCKSQETLDRRCSANARRGPQMRVMKCQKSMRARGTTSAPCFMQHAEQSL